MRSNRDERILKVVTSMMDDEPIIVFRAKDILSTMVLLDYISLLGKYVPGTIIEADALEKLEEFRSWQVNNPDKVRLPD